MFERYTETFANRFDDRPPVGKPTYSNGRGRAVKSTPILTNQVQTERDFGDARKTVDDERPVKVVVLDLVFEIANERIDD